jgi:hypothetical protein
LLARLRQFVSILTLMSMKTQRYKTILLTAAHVVIALGLLAGYETSIAIIKFLTGTVSTNASTVTSSAKGIYTRIVQLDPIILYAAIGGVLLLAYDLKLVGGWFSSFRFASSRQCKRCKIKTIRTERQPMDRVLSVVFPVKRFVCLGCGKQYLMPDTRKRSQTVEAPQGATPEAAAAASAPVRTRNRFR